MDFHKPGFASYVSRLICVQRKEDLGLLQSPPDQTESMARRGVILTLTECYRHPDYREPIVSLKLFFLWHFVDENTIKVLVGIV